MADTAESILDPADEAKQAEFVRTFLKVVAGLVVFTLFCVFIARILSASAPTLENDPILRADVMKRIAPVGAIRTSADVEEDSGEAVVAVAQSGEQIVQGVCAGCHLSGAANAPKLDDSAAWAERRELGLDALTASVINGKGVMPPRAGTSLSDDELRAAVAHMAGIETESAADEGSEASEEASQEATQSEGAAASDSSADDAAADSGSDADAAATVEEAGDAATDTVAETTEATAESSTEATTMVAAAASDRVKGVVDGICSACHLSGVGGAPKIGDAEAWAAKAEKGLAEQVAIVAAGKGAMPPRGGSDLSDDELASAIQYLMSK